MSDRQNKPSASGIARLASCSGSFGLESGMPDSSTPEAESGTRIHAVIALKADRDTLTPEELEICESCEKIEHDVVEQWRLRHHIDEVTAVHVVRDSERLWFRDRCSGLADVVYICGELALVLDFKTGRVAADDGSENLQLRCLAVLVKANYKAVTQVEVAIIQPLVTHTPEICIYEGEELWLAQVELEKILDAANKPDAPLNPGDHCRYCKAASICPAVHKEVETLSALTIHETGLTVSDEKMAELRGKCGVAKKMIASIEAEAFKRAEADPETWRRLGYEIKAGAGKRSVENVAMVGERLNALGASWTDISGECSITIKSVETLTRSATNEKGIGLKRKVDEVLAGCVEVKTAKASLKRIGNNEEE
jgi:hypothetical protein